MAKPSILLVEDDFALADNLKALLELKGFAVSHAADGAVGVEQARLKKPDLILLDILIPRVDGFDVCRILRSDPTTKDIKILIMTGLGGMGDVEKAFSCGASDYIIKPFDSERLLKKIEKVLRK